MLDELLIMVKNKVKIRKIRLGELLMDRGFEYNKTLRVLEAHKIRALFPVKKNQRVKRLHTVLRFLFFPIVYTRPSFYFLVHPFLISCPFLLA